MQKTFLSNAFGSLATQVSFPKPCNLRKARTNFLRYPIIDLAYKPHALGLFTAFQQFLISVTYGRHYLRPYSPSSRWLVPYEFMAKKPLMKPMVLWLNFGCCTSQNASSGPQRNLVQTACFYNSRILLKIEHPRRGSYRNLAC